ncbi:hypothetical protein P0W64_00330 [Tsukamurella sp. 8F]|uniref:TetR/AcrR family transcriptional regulator n=1 Tax=unclassified Tsukamurella TaxID=2633480 RepID=UPI0023B99C92|nr:MULTISPECIES: hypothetical protein [unclassified Tsukamurella]MDF0531270.1 hypothetical protein [Tsukamurella sp. 8J]MDF0585219.1 hypothetical protein [Tsukamurella sp. 8F]
MASRYRTGITADRIVGEAVELTARKGLYEWSIRDLVAEIGTSHSVVYEKVGGRDQLCGAVAQRVFEGVPIPVPDAGVDWRDALLAWLIPLCRHLYDYPGVAKWLTLHGGPTAFPTPHDGVGRFVECIADAGFSEPGRVFGACVVTAMSAVMVADERGPRQREAVRDHATMMDSIEQRAQHEPALAALMPYLDDFANRNDERRATEAQLALTMNALLDGFEWQRRRAARQDRER